MISYSKCRAKLLLFVEICKQKQKNRPNWTIFLRWNGNLKVRLADTMSCPVKNRQWVVV